MAGDARFFPGAQMRFDRFDVFVIMAIETHRVAGFLQELRHVGLMRVVTGQAVIDSVMGEFRLRLFEEIIVAIPAQRRAGPGHELLVVARVRCVALHAFAVADGLVHIFLFGDISVALHAGCLRRFLQEPFEIRGVRRVAIQAIAGFDRLMFHLAGRQRIIVTGQAKLVAFFDQKIFVRRLMRIVATGALAIFNRLMFHFQTSHEIFVTRETQLPRGQFRLRRHAAIAVALRAFAFTKRLMNDHHRASRLNIRRGRYDAVLLVR
jgi:hypothetical protein